MPIRLLFILLLFSSEVFAEKLSVHYGFYGYSLELENDFVHIQRKGLNLKVLKEKCNEKDFSRFSDMINLAIKKMDTKKGKEERTVEVETLKKSSYFSPKSPQGRFFLGVPDQFETLKIKSNIVCKTKKNK